MAESIVQRITKRSGSTLSTQHSASLSCCFRLQWVQVRVGGLSARTGSVANARSLSWFLQALRLAPPHLRACTQTGQVRDKGPIK